MYGTAWDYMVLNYTLCNFFMVYAIVQYRIVRHGTFWYWRVLKGTIGGSVLESDCDIGPKGEARTLGLCVTSVPKVKLGNYFCRFMTGIGWGRSKN